ncbi:sensor histidine kinase [Chitinophagaceae bacterium LWZ2-11]
MKKNFPVIVVLISLSLLGLIVLQASWLRNLLTVRQAQLYNRVLQASSSVAVDLYKGTPGSPTFKIPKRLGIGRFGELKAFGKSQRLRVDERFSQQDIYNKLKAAFKEEDYGNVKFEFAVADANDEFEMFSPGYLKAIEDSSNNQIVMIAIGPDNPSDLENGGPYEHLVVITPNFKKEVWDSLKWVITGAAIFMLIIISAFYVTLRTLFTQKKLSEIKSDFINNMTHEFKTPLATISLAVDAVRNEKVQNNKEKMEYFTGIIKEENKRMNKHVETILQAALMEKQELQFNLKELHVHDIIRAVLENYQLQLQDKQAKVELKLNAKTDVINADEIHFTNLLSNLIDNAIKYSKEESLKIKVVTHSTNKFLVITIEDNGIGMSKESVKRVFEKFYRAHTGNVHNIKGFGLGMSYVKTVVDAHKGRIKVDSTLGKGSIFTIELPVKK